MINPIAMKKFLSILNELEISYFVSGGIGLDGLRGYFSRDHKDIDLYMFSTDLENLIKKLKESGYRCFRKLNKFEIQGEGMLVDVLPLCDEGDTFLLNGNAADTRFPKGVFTKHQTGELGGEVFRVAPGEVFALEMPYSRYAVDREYALSIPYDRLQFEKIENIQKEKPVNIVLKEL